MLIFVCQRIILNFIAISVAPRYHNIWVRRYEKNSQEESFAINIEKNMRDDKKSYDISQNIHNEFVVVQPFDMNHDHFYPEFITRYNFQSRRYDTI
jgi:hypothetical protein